MAAHRLDEISRATGLQLAGNGSIEIARPAEPGLAGPYDLALAMNSKFAEALSGTHAKAAVVWAGADWQSYGLEGVLFADKPRVALAGITEFHQHPVDVAPGIHAAAMIEPGTEIGPGAAIGPFAVIGKNARIGANAKIASHVTIGSDARIGDDAILHAGVRIGARCQIGHRFIAQPNAVIGADGFSFEPPDRSAVEAARASGSAENTIRAAQYLRIHSLAAVEIADDVEIGASSTIDRGTISPTRIGSGTKIDNLVQLGHNVQVGETCLLCAQVGIAGSTTLGDRVVLGGRVGIADHRKIGSDVMCAAGSLVAGNIPDRSIMLGIPAAPRDQAARQIAAIRRLPRLIETVSEIQKKLGL